VYDAGADAQPEVAVVSAAESAVCDGLLAADGVPPTDEHIALLRDADTTRYTRQFVRMRDCSTVYKNG